MVASFLESCLTKDVRTFESPLIFSSFSLVVVFVMLYAFKEAALLDLTDIQNKMSQEQRETYVLNYVQLSFILVASVMGALIASFLIFLVQLRVETERAAREARNAKLRRLQYRVSGKEVTISALPDDLNGMKFWHVFLSHTCVSRHAVSLFLATACRFLVCIHEPLCVHASACRWVQGQTEMRIVKDRLREMLPEICVFLDTDARQSAL